YGRGFTPDIQNTISSGLVEITTLGDFCKYGKPQTQPYPIAEGAQQRVPDLISDMVKATILGTVSKGIQGLGAGFAAITDSKTKVHMGVNFIRAGIALRMIEKNGEAPAPEEMLVGLQGLPEFPTFRTEYPT
ncbi:17935_t:CDS:2, partial [Funneliformis geosporum]